MSKKGFIAIKEIVAVVTNEVYNIPLSMEPSLSRTALIQYLVDHQGSDVTKTIEDGILHVYGRLDKVNTQNVFIKELTRRLTEYYSRA